jgi:hypothetical protein
MINSKIIYFLNKSNDFAQNYFAESLEGEFHATKKGSSPKGWGLSTGKRVEKILKPAATKLEEKDKG